MLGSPGQFLFQVCACLYVHVCVYVCVHVCMCVIALMVVWCSTICSFHLLPLTGQDVAGISMAPDAKAWDRISIRPGVVTSGSIGRPKGARAEASGSVGTNANAVDVAGKRAAATAAVIGTAPVANNVVGGADASVGSVRGTISLSWTVTGERLDIDW
jgi:hypothetical protein